MKKLYYVYFRQRDGTLDYVSTGKLRVAYELQQFFIQSGCFEFIVYR